MELNKSIKRIQERKSKIKINEKNVQTHGVFRPNFGGVCKEFRPIRKLATLTFPA